MGLAGKSATFMRRARRSLHHFLALVIAVSTLSAISVVLPQSSSAATAGSGNCVQTYSLTGTGQIGVFESGGYCYVAFKNTGAVNSQATYSWTRPAGLNSVDVLVVGGGGGGGTRTAGGGGAGEYVEATSYSVAGNSTIAIGVGAGGAGAAGQISGGSATFIGTNGQTSFFKTSGSPQVGLTAVGGGYGAYSANANGGGSGGGSSYNPYTPGSPTNSAQKTLANTDLSSITFGNSGAAGANDQSVNYDYWTGGGGGGAGAAGKRPTYNGVELTTTQFPAPSPDSSGAALSARGGNGGSGKSPNWLPSTVASELAIGQYQASDGKVYFAGGGGGGIGADAAAGGDGGVGGGGSGFKFSYPIATNSGTAFTGGGGGSGGYDDIPGDITVIENSITYVEVPGGNGGSGVVLVRYQVQPAAPTITGITGGNNSLSVAFTAPTNGSTVTGYKYSTDGGSTWSASTGSTSSPITISGLTNGTSYQVQIRAVNTYWDGVATASTTAVAGTVCSPTSASASGYTTLTFTSSSTCIWSVPAGVTKADVLVVAGGGAGGAGIGGGGGAGQVFETLNTDVSGNISVTVGNGGAGGNSVGAVGSNTIFGSRTAYGGGGGGANLSAPTTASKGSGGGGGYGSTGASIVADSPGKASAGGSGNYTVSNGIGCESAAGGGGGATGAGANGTGTASQSIGSGGAGGAGFQSTITGLFYGGGGGGGLNGLSPCIPTTGTAGAGGTGGGGAGAPKDGSTSRAGIDGTAGTGGGGGGSSNGTKGGDGGSGVVVVRYVNPPSISLSTSTINATVGSSVTSYTITNSNGPAASYAISPSLAVSGLSFSTSSGLISGTPTATASSANYTITATNTSGTSTATFSLSATYSTCSPSSSSSGGYTTLTFSSASTCEWSVPAGVSSADVLVVGGGGGGAANWSGSTGAGGSGGGGGVYTATAVPVSGTVVVTVGAGGAAGVSTTSQTGRSGSQGVTSAFGTLTAGGGGGGGCETGATNGQPCGNGTTIHGLPGTAGGNGGSPSNFWNAYNYGSPGTASNVTIGGKTFTAVTGFQGGIYVLGSSVNNSAGSAGGAGGAGAYNTPGAGVTSTLTGSTIYGKGGSSWNATSWDLNSLSANRGFGGNGGYSSTGSATNGVSGSSGIVVVKYATVVSYTYDANGGTGTAPTGGSAQGGTSFTTAANPYSRSGYTFAGWNTAANGSGTSLTANASNSMPVSATPIVLYAQWTANSNAISYDNQGATTSQSGGSTTYTSGSAISTIPTTAPLRTYYTFVGWFTSASGGTQVTNGSYVPPSPYGGITLYAQWTLNGCPNPTTANGYSVVSITSVGLCSWSVPSGISKADILVVGGGGAGGTATNGAGGGGGGGQVNAQAAVTVSGTYSVQVGAGGTAQSTASATPGGDGGTSSVTPSSGTAIIALGGSGGASVTVGTGDLGRGSPGTAGFNGGGGSVWADRVSATNGSNGVGGSKGGAAIGSGSDANVQAAGGGGGSGVGAVGANATSGNGGSGGTGGTGLSNSYIGTATIYGGGGGGGKRTNTGTAGSGGSGGGGAGGKAANGTAGSANTGGGGGGGGGETNAVGGAGGSGIVIIRYASIVNYTYDANGGTGTAPTAGSAQGGTAFTTAANPFSRTGYTFSGWYTTSTGTGGTSYTANASNTMQISATSIVLYAQWSADSNSISYDNQGATTSQSGGSTSYTSGSAILTIPTSAPAKTGYTFNGWFTASTGGTQVTDGSYTPSTPFGAITLYAQWSSTSRVITFNANDGSGTPATSTQSVVAGVSTALTQNTFTRTGYEFLGWATAADGSGTTYLDQANITTSNAITLYAVWFQNTNLVLEYGSSTFTSSSSTWNPMVGSINANRTISGGSSSTWSPASTTSPAYSSSSISGELFTTGNTKSLFTSNTVSIFAWVYPLGNNHSVVQERDTGVFTSAPTVHTTIIEMVSGVYNFMLPGCTPIAASSSTTTGFWHHVGLTYDGTTLRGYVDGAEVASGPCTRTVPATNLFYGVGGNDGNDMNPSAQAKGNIRLSSIQFFKTAIPLLKVSNLHLYSTITFKSNYTSGPSDTTLKVSNGTNVSLTANSFTRSTIPFLRWSNTATQNTAYLDGVQVNLRGNLNLYAQWGYIVTLRPGDFSSGSNQTYYKNYQTNLSLPNSSVASSWFTRSGYTIAGWSINADGSTQDYALSGAYSTDAAITLYPYWQVNTVSVIFNNNGGSGTMTNQSIVPSTATSLTSNTFTRTGYTFNGWNTNADGTSGTNYTNGQSVTITSGMTLYAKWLGDTLVVTYDSQGGTSVTAGSVATGANLTAPTAPTKAGYTFSGWSTTSTGSVVSFSGGYTHGQTSSFTLYAIWAANALTVTYNSKDGTDVANGTVNTGASISSAPTAPTKTGYTFSGWSATDGGTVVTFPYAHGNTANFTMYAIWSANTLTITYDEQSGSSIADGTVLVGASISAAPPAPTRAGYTLSGWSTTSTGSVVSFPHAHGQTDNFTLYAIWAAISCSPTSTAAGGYTIYTFTTAGTCFWTVPNGVTDVEILAVAGGGGGGYAWDNAGAGGGAGGQVKTGTATLSTTLEVTVGAGGSAGSVSSTRGGTGGNTVVSTITALGGTGGCGARSTSCSNSAQATSLAAANGGAGGAGGASGKGGGGSNTSGSLTSTTAGGTGTASTYSGSSVTYGVGGTGGTARSGTTNVVGPAGSANTGNGGGGASAKSSSGQVNGGAGGTGLVVVRVPSALTITFDTQGGSAVSDTSTVTAGIISTAPADPTRTNYTFQGWFTATSGGTAISFPYAHGQTANFTLYAQWSLNTYAITFNKNNVDATGSMGNQTFTHGVAFNVNANLYSRPNYVFYRWATQADGTGTTYNNLAQVTLTARTTLYAQWTANTYVVTFNYNGGDGGDSTPTDSFTTGGTAITLPVPTKTGFTFAGWHSDAALSTPIGSNNGSGNYSPTGATLTLNVYAKWTAVDYTFTYNANSAGSGSVPTESSKQITQTVTVKANTGSLVRSGYTFGGWNTQSNGGGTTYLSGSLFTVGSSNVTLYAKWNANTYTVTYNNNGGTGSAQRSSANVTSDSYTTGGASVTLPDVGTLARSGYTFGGWNTSAAGDGTNRLAAATYTTVSDVILYAKWEPVTYTITYNANSGTGSAPTSGGYTTGQASPYTVLSNSFSKTSHVFGGWNTANNGTGTSYSPGSSITTLQDIVLYAVWIPQFTLHYAINGGTVTSGSLPNDALLTINTPVSVFSSVARTGYTFDGWVNGATTIAPGGSFNIVEDSVLTAKWTAINYQVSYNSDGGTTPPSSFTKQIGQSYTIGNAPTKPGHDFLGWKAGSTIVGAGATIVMGSSDISYTAQWAAQIYTISYDWNGGRGTAVSDVNYTYGTTAITLPLVGDRVKDGYTFAGWSESLGGSALSATYIPSQSRTLYALWNVGSFTITYNLAGGTLANTSVAVQNGSSTVLPLPTRANFVFNGWHTATTGGSSVGSNGASFTPSASQTVYARWIQASLYGITDSLTRIGSVVTVANVANTFSGANSSSSVIVSVPANALPAGTTINFDMVGNSSRATGLLPNVSYLISIAISWIAGDGTVPDTASGKPISVTISNATIKAGAAAYAIVNNVSTLLGTASQDGTITIELTSDPEVVIAATKPEAPTNVSATSNGNQQSMVSWNAPTSNGGSAITGYTVTATPSVSTPAGCSGTTNLSCTFTGLANGTAYAFTVTATNTVGTSVASSSATGTTASLYAVTFDAKGGSAVTSGSFLTASTVSEPTAPTRTGYSFAGWSATDGGSAEVFPYAPGVTSAITMYARWDALDNAVTFDSKGGSDVTASVFSSGGTVTEPTAPTRSGYTFAGWSATDGGSVVTFPYAPGVVTDITLYAKWTVANQGGGSGGGNSNNNNSGGNSGNSNAGGNGNSSSQAGSIAPGRGNVTTVAPVVVVGKKETKVPTFEVALPTVGSEEKPATVKIAKADEKVVSEVKIVEGKLALTPETGFSGKKTVTVTVNENGAERVVQIPLTVLPEPVTKPVVTPTSANRSTIRWTQSPNADTYTVYLNGKKVCTTSASSCTVTRVLGPDAEVKIVSNGGDRTVSTRVEADFRQTNPVQITRLVSATITKSTLSKVDTKALDKVIALIKSQGFGTVVISEITTTKKTEAKADARIAAIKKYIESKLGSEKVEFEVVPPASRTYFNNISVKG